MTFWSFFDKLLDRLPGWPSEKQLVMLTTFGMGFTMIIMAHNDPTLWGVELFKTLITVVIVTGCINMILAFYFTANKSDEQRAVVDEKRAETTAKAFDAITATANASSTDSSTIREGDSVTLEKKND
jgi:uncharacterized protein YacL